MSGVVVAYAVRTPAVTGRPDGSSLPRPGWVVRLGAGVRRPPARGGVPFARRLRFAHVCSLVTHELPYLAIPTHPGCSLTFAPNPTYPGCPHSPTLPRLPHSSSVPPHQPGCKRLHLSFCPSWAVKSAGRAKSRIVTHLCSLPPLPTLPCLPRSSSVPPHTARLQALASEF